ncbi:MAG TPA: MGMT family protein [archaeon]|nr:MGMT family protein [archaeon]
MSKKLLVYELLKKVPKGKVISYDELAKAVGTSPRAIGAFMHCNADTKDIPCYKVVSSNGCLGGYSKGIKKKITLLKKCGIKIKSGKIGKKYFYKFC